MRDARRISRSMGASVRVSSGMTYVTAYIFLVLACAFACHAPARSFARQCARRVRTWIALTLRLGKFSRARWVVKLLGLCAYALVLSPAFLRVAWRCATSKDCEMGVPYGSAPRNNLDLYFPNDGAEARRRRREAIGRRSNEREQSSSDEASSSDGERDAARPVVIFVTGGMWIIGYKAWGALLAQRLARRGCIVASLDYRNFPQGTIGDMIADIGCGIGWVLDRLDALGGDRRKVVIVGQSAGAHIAATALLRQAGWAMRVGSPNGWSPGAISRFIGISGVYAPDDDALVEHVHRQGLYKNVFWSIMEAGFSGARAREALPRASPVSIIRERDVRENVRIIPPVMLCHGEADTSAPPAQSKMFAAALRSVGIAVEERYYAGKTHTDPFVTDPILGRDVLLDDITNYIFGRRLPPFDEKPLVPRVFVALARLVVPF